MNDCTTNSPPAGGSGDAPVEPSPDAAAPPPVTAEMLALKDSVIAVMKTVFDPEIPVNIYELGMVYGVEVKPDLFVKVRMTLTSPACPVAGSLPGEVEAKVKGVAGVNDAKVDLVWDPPWHPDMMSEAAKLTLGF